ncbi:helix-turn-helix transcriptional regulator [Enterococcus saccharolyticus]|uniref:Transcriptional regulator n=1 Tax=Candidatus Enterococcus willemsii TaxID=1857215 RepID=A0ABQ6Z0N6_9ENTE|nr:MULTISPECIES: helix-turn-helix transcriptional regulator [Enterococcus]KAF1304587.1 transcriptional regulator [Enterococcus sp. CU12B]MCD5001322.1 helix-turn-helix transcriptional regulator [Enterococcus saccharolyticus]
MNVGKQIRSYRQAYEFSQEELAEKIFVSRQTISNWENARSYPDIHSLLLLSVLFDISLDELVKGDVNEMKKTLKQMKSNKDTVWMVIFLLLMILTTGPLLAIQDGGWIWLVVPFTFWMMGMYFAVKVEKFKKQEDLKTFAEITAYMENRDVESLRKKRNKRKALLEKIMIVLLFSVGSALLTILFGWLTSLIVSFT